MRHSRTIHLKNHSSFKLVLVKKCCSNFNLTKFLVYKNKFPITHYAQKISQISFEISYLSIKATYKCIG